jgi:hypothetical protein
MKKKNLIKDDQFLSLDAIKGEKLTNDQQKQTKGGVLLPYAIVRPPEPISKV